MIPSVNLNDDEFALLNEFLSAELGIAFPEHKREVLESRLRPRLRTLKLRSYLDYYLMLREAAMNGRGEVRELTRVVTNNETYFFRETYQFDAFFEHALDGLKQSSATKSLRLLSAGCSSGEEPYTLSVYTRENQFRLMGWDVAIDAFDASESRITIARGAEYGPSSLRGMSEEQIAHYFVKGKDGYAIKPSYRAGVNFRVANILRPEAFSGGSYDAIFCRNVLIYFTDATIREVLCRFAAALRLDGLLFLGHSESIIGVTPAFEPLRVGNCIAYRRTATRAV